ncbi:small-subunit processome [Trichophaea hybrida]|nr:small-subunit processome [Trichophaea hybrida]
MARSKPAGAARKSGRINQKRALNAFAIASAAENSKSTRPAPAPRRSKEDEDDAPDEGSVDGGSDSDGNEWRLGEVASDDDSDINSDDAMGESDEERFEDFTFRGSTGGTKKKKVKDGKELDLSEGEEDDDDEDMEDEDGEEEEKRASKKRRAPVSDDEMGDFGHGSSDGSESESEFENDNNDSFTRFSEEEEDNMEEDELKLEALESLISELPTSNDKLAKRARINDPNEGKAPGEYNLALTSESKKLTIEDLLPSVADPALKKSLKLLADDGKNRSDKKGVPGKLSAPLAKRMQDRIDRAAAYGETKETLKRWVDTVKHNREAEHLHFPLANAPNAPVVASKKLAPITVGGSAPLNSFEASISGILKESNMASEKQIQEFEQLETQKLSIQDVERRTAELRMARELMYREELKAKRIKKIKSKSYHRIKKKERLRQEEAIREALAEERDGEPDSEEEMERERRRAVERMSLKHKQSRWAKGIKDSGRTAWDEDARHGAMAMAQRSEELRRKIQGEHVGSDDEESSDEESEDEFDEEGEDRRAKILQELEKIERTGNDDGGSKLMAMKFMQNAEASKRKENEAMIQSLKDAWEDDERGSDSGSEELTTSGRMSFKPGKKDDKPVSKKQEREEFEALPDSGDESEREEEEEEVEIANEASSKAPKQKNPFSAPNGLGKAWNDGQRPFAKDVSEPEETVNPWLPQDANKNLVKPKAKALVTGKQESKDSKTNHKLSKARKTALNAAEEAADGDTRITIDTNLTLKVARRQDTDEAEGDDEGQVQLIPIKGKKLESQRELVKMAFAGDNVVREFKKDKKQIADDDDDQIIDQTLPGWGSWAGTGLTKQQRNANKRRKVLQTVKGINKDKRKDFKLEKVIINEKRDKKATKFQATVLPHPFETKAQYERSLRLPIGPEWTTKSTFQNATMPRVMIKTGRVVEPISAPFK